MNESNLFEIKKYEFSSDLLSKIESDHYVKGLWPLVYIISDGNIKEAYVGETTDTFSRMSTHLKNSEKKKLTAVRLITSDKFNKSATLDIESNLIKYLSGDGQYKLLNGNVGLANHTYYQKKEIYWDIFKTLWNELKSEGITRNSLDHINNSNLYKYSPYKSLSYEQRGSLVEIIKSLIERDSNSIVIEGGAGTGKTILAIFLFKLLNSDIEDFNLDEFGADETEFIKLVTKLKDIYPKPSMALVVPMSSFRNTLKKVFKNIKGLNANMVISPAEVTKNKFDIIVVDESHRLRKRVSLGTYFGAFDKANERLRLDKYKGNELDWIVKQGKKRILFYDENQSIKPSDVDKRDFDVLKSDKNTVIKILKSQFRVKGGNDYVTYIDELLNCKFRKDQIVFDSKEYEFKLFSSLEEMHQKINEREVEYKLSRIIAGYAWKWVSKKKKELYDIIIGDVKLRWNSVSDDYINSDNSINEVGCIHTTQGYDLNYAGIIFGPEISYDKYKNEIVIIPENYYDKNGKQSIDNPEQLKGFIINIYKTVMLRGIKGTYVYVCDKNLREYFQEHIALYKNETKKEKVYGLTKSPYVGEFINVPLYESVGCGELMLAQTTSEETIPVKSSLVAKGSKHFILRTSGDSMNQVGINDGDLVLCRKNYHPEEGNIVVALIGNDATIKKFHREKDAIVLLPCSDNPKHKPLRFTDNEEMSVQGVVIKVLQD